jgi:type II secretory ATPase GspE/PulE/Tfp pilus assembly ATPase PilB-like protein
MDQEPKNNEIKEGEDEQANFTAAEKTREEADLGHQNVIQENVQPLFGLIEAAINQSATDIHLDPIGDQFIIRLRINGMIRTYDIIPRDDAKQLLMQMCVRAKLNITRTFLPQEGQSNWIKGDEVKDLRVTLVPRHGMVSAHLRILTPPEALTDITKLGFQNKDLDIVRRNLARSQGLIIVGGPTGAGKTTTIYSLANHFDLKSMIGVSIEDPIEFDIPYLRQVEVDTQHGFQMHDGLRALLRMDPDLLIVTEIRDELSALTAVRAAAAANFVLTTIHSRDAAAAVEAFHFLSVPYNILGGSLKLIIAQNLVRRLCSSCRVAKQLSDDDLQLFERWEIPVPDEIFEPTPNGCQKCDQYGFHGRTGIFEVVEIDEEIGRSVINGISQMDLRQMFRKKGFDSLFKSGLRKVAEGETSMTELLDIYWPQLGDSGVD